jgi:hypothetical protein
MSDNDQNIHVVEGDLSDPATGIAQLKASVKAGETALAQERATRQRLEREAAELRGNVEQSRSSLLLSRQNEVSAALDSAKRAAEAAEAKYRAAIEAADVDLQIEAQKELSTALFNSRMAEEAKVEVEGAIRQNDAETQAHRDNPKPAQRQPHDPKLAAWMSDNPQYATDQTFRAKALAGHYDAVGKGLQLNSDAYFANVNKFAHGDAAQVTVDPPRPAAPASGTPPARETSSPPVNGQRMQITKAEAEIASNMGMSNLEYWQYKEAQKAGTKPADYFAQQRKKS